MEGRCGRVRDERQVDGVLLRLLWGLVQYRDGVVELTRRNVLLRGSSFDAVSLLRDIDRLELGVERNGEVVPQRVYNDHYSLVVCLGVPAPFLRIARYVALGELNRRDGAFGLVRENETREQETGREEVCAEDVEGAAAC